MRKWWTGKRRPGTGVRLWSWLGAIAFGALATFEGVSKPMEWAVAGLMLLCAILGELAALRLHADARWDAAHGPVRETIQVRGAFNPHDVRVGTVVQFDGKEYRVEQVEHRIDAVGFTNTDFTATRQGEG
jgi:hypothetical protein